MEPSLSDAKSSAAVSAFSRVERVSRWASVVEPGSRLSEEPGEGSGNFLVGAWGASSVRMAVGFAGVGM